MLIGLRIIVITLTRLCFCKLYTTFAVSDLEKVTTEPSDASSSFTEMYNLTVLILYVNILLIMFISVHSYQSKLSANENEIRAAK